MRESQTPRVVYATLTLVLCFLLSDFRLVKDAPLPGKVEDSSDDVAKRSDLRFAALKAVLPQRGVVGYVGENGTDALGDYYLAQYALAPLVVDHSSDHELVVGNFPSGPGDTPEGLHLVRDFGDGIELFARKGGE